jgi:hypothetical protein
VHDEAQVRLDHVRLGVEVAALDALGQLDLLLGVQERHAPDRLEERLEAVGGGIREVGGLI